MYPCPRLCRKNCPLIVLAHRVVWHGLCVVVFVCVSLDLAGFAHKFYLGVSFLKKLGA